MSYACFSVTSYLPSYLPSYLSSSHLPSLCGRLVQVMYCPHLS